MQRDGTAAEKGALIQNMETVHVLSSGCIWAQYCSLGRLLEREVRHHSELRCHADECARCQDRGLTSIMRSGYSSLILLMSRVPMPEPVPPPRECATWKPACTQRPYDHAWDSDQEACMCSGCFHDEGAAWRGVLEQCPRMPVREVPIYSSGKRQAPELRGCVRVRPNSVLQAYLVGSRNSPPPSARHPRPSLSTRHPLCSGPWPSCCLRRSA